MDFFVSPEFRKWAYGVCVAISSLLGILGVYNGEVLGAVNVILAAFFGIAFINTPNSLSDLNREANLDYEPKH